MKSYRLRAAKNKNLNDVVHYIYEHKPDLRERAGQFQLIEGLKTIAGSGDPVIVELIVRYSNPTESDIADMEEIINIARRGGDDIEVTVSEE